MAAFGAVATCSSYVRSDEYPQRGEGHGADGPGGVGAQVGGGDASTLGPRGVGQRAARALHARCLHERGADLVGGRRK